MIKKTVNIFVVLVFFSLKCFAQNKPSIEPTPAPNPSVGSNLPFFYTQKIPYEFWLTLLIGIIGLTIISLLIWAVRSSGAFKPEDVTRPVIIVTIVICALILITAGYSNEQIAPAFGLFGTIIGYILGRIGSSADKQSKDGM